MRFLILLLLSIPALLFSFELIPAVFTPYNSDLTIDYEKIQAYATFLSEKQNITTVFISGTNGESLSLSFSERKQLVDAWAKTSQKIIVMVSAESIVDAISLSSYVSKVSSSNPNIIGIAAMSPSFFKPSSAQDLIDYLLPIASASPNLDFRYYHIPSMTGLTISMTSFQTLASSQIKNFKGIKYTDTDLFTLRKCVKNANEGVTHYFGKDEILITGIQTGAKSAVGSTYNFMGPVGYEIVSSFFDADLEKAGEKQDEIVEVVEAWGDLEGIPAQKAIMEMVGMDLGRGVRPPLRSLTDDEYSELEQSLKEIGFLD